MRKYTRNLTLSALFLALGYVLPFLTGQIPQFGSMLLPMHIPVFLCALICGWQYGAVIGFILPLTRCLFFSMPPVYVAIAMAFELAAYGAASGLLYRVLPKKIGSIYAALVLSMIAGRLVWGVARYLLAGLAHSTFTPSLFLAGAVTSALPGIALHILLIPALVTAMEKTKLILN